MSEVLDQLRQFYLMLNSNDAQTDGNGVDLAALHQLSQNAIKIIENMNENQFSEYAEGMVLPNLNHINTQITEYNFSDQNPADINKFIQVHNSLDGFDPYILTSDIESCIDSLQIIQKSIICLKEQYIPMVERTYYSCVSLIKSKLFIEPLITESYQTIAIIIEIFHKYDNIVPYAQESIEYFKESTNIQFSDIAFQKIIENAYKILKNYYLGHSLMAVNSPQIISLIEIFKIYLDRIFSRKIELYSQTSNIDEQLQTLQQSFRYLSKIYKFLFKTVTNNMKEYFMNELFEVIKNNLTNSIIQTEQIQLLMIFLRSFYDAELYNSFEPFIIEFIDRGPVSESKFDVDTHFQSVEIIFDYLAKIFKRIPAAKEQAAYWIKKSKEIFNDNRLSEELFLTTEIIEKDRKLVENWNNKPLSVVLKQPTESVTIEQMGSVQNKICIRFRCLICEKWVSGFPDVYSEYSHIPINELNKEDFCCPVCGESWEKLTPYYYMYFDCKINNEYYSLTGVGSVMDEIMGFTVSEYMALGNEIGYKFLFNLTGRFFKFSTYDVRKINQEIKTISAPCGNRICVFKNWIVMQPGIDQETVDLIVSGDLDELADEYAAFAPDVKMGFVE